MSIERCYGCEETYDTDFETRENLLGHLYCEDCVIRLMDKHDVEDADDLEAVMEAG